MKKTLTAIITTLAIAGSADAKNLTVYFSVTDNTTKLAETIHGIVGGDIMRIEPVNPYPAVDYMHKELTDLAQKEKNENARPAFKEMNLDLNEYDTIYVGYPIWWYTLPMIMYNFFETYDFSGKTIVPFNTHGGSSDGGTYETIRGWEPNATVLDGLPITGTDMVNDQTETVKAWLERIGK